MLLLLRKLNSSCCSSSHCSNQITTFHQLFKSWVFFSTAVDKIPSLKTPPFIVQYLIESCGLSREEAVKTSLPIARIKSTKNLDLVVDFLRKNGFEQSHIRRLVSLQPLLLCSNVEKTMEPKIRALHNAGFNSPELVRLISASPNVLLLNAGKKIEFLRTLLVTKERFLLAVEANPHLLSSSLNQRIIPNVSLLRKCVISENKLPIFVLRRIRLLNSKTSRIKEIIEVLQKFGFSPNSKTFEHAFYVFCSISTSNLNSKCELLKSYGFSEVEVRSAVQKYPRIVGLSEKNVRLKMAFFMEEVGWEPSDIALRSSFLTYSLEKRIKPRYHFLQALKSRGLHVGKANFLSILQLSEKRFLEKYGVKYTEMIPELPKVYDTASSKLCS